MNKIQKPIIFGSCGLIILNAILVFNALYVTNSGLIMVCISGLFGFCSWFVAPILINIYLMFPVEKPETLMRRLVYGGFWGGLIGLVVEAIVLILLNPRFEGLYVCLVSMYFGLFAIVAGAAFVIIREYLYKILGWKLR